MRKLLHRFELRVVVLAMLALTVAQLGALSHAYAHDAAVRTSATHQTAVVHDLCNDCIAFAPLLSPAGASGTLPSVEPQEHGPATRAAANSLFDLSLTLAFRARAPPKTR